MRDIAPSTGRPVMNKPRARKEAAKVLAVNLQARYRVYLEATGDDEIMLATGALAQCMIENIEFMIWALKSLGGMNPAPPEELRRISPALQMPANDDPRFVKPPAIVLEEEKAINPAELPCTCEPFADAFSMSMRHAASCPKHTPL